MDELEQRGTDILRKINPTRLLSEAPGQQRGLRYPEGRTLLVNDPSVRQKVEVLWTRQGYRRMSPGDEPCSGGPGHLADVVGRIVNQYAGVHPEDR